MKLVVSLPALNEEATIGKVLDDIPSAIPGISTIEKIVVDDGSTDATSITAEQHGAKVIRHPQNRGSGKAFITGVQGALEAGADIIVTMDSDGQFNPGDIPDLIAPIQEGRANVVLCSRFQEKKLVGAMPWRKRLGNWLLSKTLSLIANQTFSDVSCGFRAFSRDAALRVNVYSDYEYIHESLLTWKRHGLRIQEVGLAVLAERPHGESRLMRSVLRYGWRTAPVLLRAIRDYSPMKFFGLLSLVVSFFALIFGLIVSVHWLKTGETAPFTSFITLSVGGFLLAFLLGILALIADLIARIRFQLEELLYESRKKRAMPNPRRRKRPKAVPGWGHGSHFVDRSR